MIPALRDKFKTKKDLHNYMSHNCRWIFIVWLTICLFLVEIYLPDLGSCRLSFLQAIMCDLKKCIFIRDVKTKNINDRWNDWAVKNAYPLIKNNQIVREYLPSDEMD